MLTTRSFKYILNLINIIQMHEKNSVENKLNIDYSSLHAYSTGLLQGKAYRVLQFHLTKALFPYDLSIPEWKLLGQLCDHGPMKLIDLAEILDVKAPLVTRLSSQLEKKKLIRREYAPGDKRIKIIHLLLPGKRMLPMIEKGVKARMGKLLVGTSQADLHTYVRVLASIVNNSYR